MYSNEEATDIVSSIRRETIFIYPVMNSLKSRDQYNSLMGEACLTREASFPCDLLDTIEGQNAFLTRITSITELQHGSVVVWRQPRTRHAFEVRGSICTPMKKPPT